MRPPGVLPNHRNISLMLAAQNHAREHGWYSVNLAGDDGVAEVFIYGVIGGSFFDEGVDAGQFIREFRDLQANRIVVRINSPGGNIDDAVAIHNAIRDRSAITETHIDGHGLSAAAWVGSAASKTIMRPHSRIMIHSAHAMAMGDDVGLRKTADILDGLSNDIADTLAEKAGGTREEWRALMAEETWYGDREAVYAGLADEVGEAPAGGGAGDDSNTNTWDTSLLQIFRNAPAPVTPAVPTAPAPSPTPAPTPVPNELVRAAMTYRRDETRRDGNSKATTSVTA